MFATTKREEEKAQVRAGIEGEKKLQNTGFSEKNNGETKAPSPGILKGFLKKGKMELENSRDSAQKTSARTFKNDVSVQLP